MKQKEEEKSQVVSLIFDFKPDDEGKIMKSFVLEKKKQKVSTEG